MTRWRSGTQARLRQAAWELFGEQGYDRVTTTQIAAAAGVTQRTLFRYFVDKTELLFERPPGFHVEVVGLIHNAETADQPLMTVFSAYRTASTHFPLNAQRARAREAIVDSSAELRGRALLERASLEAATTSALVTRGQCLAAAGVASSVNGALFAQAYAAWTQQETAQSLTTHLDDCWNYLCDDAQRSCTPMRTSR